MKFFYELRQLIKYTNAYIISINEFKLIIISFWILNISVQYILKLEAKIMG